MGQAAFNVQTEIKDYIGTISFSCPPHNHVSVELLRVMADALHMLDQTDDCRVVIIRSEGKIFCAGADFNDGGDFAEDNDNVSALALYAQATRLYSNRKPIIAVIQGAAIGAGLGLALVADFRIASEQARLAANFVKLGFHAGFGISVRLPEIIGEQKSARMLLTGERVSGSTAFHWGLVDEIASAEDLSQAAHRFASTLAENAPLAIEETVITVRGNRAGRIKAATAIEAAAQGRLKQTQDFSEGVRAVAERRPGWFRRI